VAYDINALRTELFEHIIHARRDRAAELFHSAARHSGYARVVHDILEPVLVDIGERWAKDKLSLAQGYVAGKIAEDVLLAMARQSPDLPRDRKGPVVLGNVEDDHHALGRKMVAVFLAAAGWIVEDLGNDVSAKDFVDKAEEVGARVIGVSAMMLTTAQNIRAVRQELGNRGLSGRIQLAVGGAIINLRPELVSEFGGDGTCNNAIQAPALFERLWSDSLSITEDTP
jgi:methanogenic corrinoid protein MtbC1